MPPAISILPCSLAKTAKLSLEAFVALDSEESLELDPQPVNAPNVSNKTEADKSVETFSIIDSLL